MKQSSFLVSLITLPFAAARLGSKIELRRLDASSTNDETNENVVFQADAPSRDAPSPTNWGLDRIDQTDLPLNGEYRPPNNLNGQGVDIYILSTGVDRANPEFSGRCDSGKDSSRDSGELQQLDNHGAGTYAAAIAAGTKYGVAKGARIIPVKIYSDGQSRTSLSIVAGAIKWVVHQHEAVTGRKSIMFLDTIIPAKVSLVEALFENVKNSGILSISVNGIDSTKNSCDYAPMAYSSVISVSGSKADDDGYDQNFGGTCVDLFAPGHDITSACPIHLCGQGGTMMSQGGTPAAAHVAGAAALFFQANPGALASTIRSKLLSSALDGKIQSNLNGSPNKLLNVEDPYIVWEKSEWSAYVNNYEASFTAKMDGKAICGISSRYSNEYNDRQYRFRWCQPTIGEEMTTTETSTYYDTLEGFSFTCPEGSFISGTQTSYAGSCDRRFHFQCSKFAGYAFTDNHCQQTADYVNQLEGEFHFDSINGKHFVVAGIETMYDDSSADRRFKFKVCEIGPMVEIVTSEQALEDSQEVTSHTGGGSDKVKQSSWIAGAVVIGVVLFVCVGIVVCFGKKNDWSQSCGAGKKRQQPETGDSLEDDKVLEVEGVTEQVKKDDENTSTSGSTEQKEGHSSSAIHHA